MRDLASRLAWSMPAATAELRRWLAERLRRLANYLDIATNAAARSEGAGVGVFAWREGGSAELWALQSDRFGGFIDGQPCLIGRTERSGLVLVRVTRNFGFDRCVDPCYAVWPEQLRPPGFGGDPMRLWHKGQACRLYAAQAWRGDGDLSFDPATQRGVVCTVLQPQIGRSVILSVPGRARPYEAYAEQLRPLG